MGVQAESGVEKGSGRREGQPGHRPTTAIWVCGAPSWPGNLLPWKLTISEHLGRIRPLKTVHFIKRAHTRVCGCDSWLSSGLILRFPPIASSRWTTTSCVLCPMFREPRAGVTKCVRLDRSEEVGWGAGQTVDPASPRQRHSNSIKTNALLTANCSTLGCQLSSSAWGLTLSPSSFPLPPLKVKRAQAS